MSELVNELRAIMGDDRDECDVKVGLLRRAADEIERLRAAISWAMGEGDSDFGCNMLAPNANGEVPSFWWRTELRKRAGL